MINPSIIPMHTPIMVATFTPALPLKHPYVKGTGLRASVSGQALRSLPGPSNQRISASGGLKAQGLRVKGFGFKG